ncbi:hypothetical protein OA855_01820 [Pelagibacteraceae bacterium]|nr:hypothetical protein [Pelagibacteraceae bacterium]
MNKKFKIAINGFGRIGRAITKIQLNKNEFDIVLINDINPQLNNLAYLLKYDSTYGNINKDIKVKKNKLFLDNKEIQVTSFNSITNLDLKKYNVDILVDCSGVKFKKSEYLKLIKKEKIKNIIITHSSNESQIEIIMGLNDHKIQKKHKIISSSICDANAISHVINFVENNYKIVSGSVTTLHPWLSYQNLIDGSSTSVSNPSLIWDDYALGRASANNIIPKNTTAVTAVEKVLPKIRKKLVSFSYRTPTDIVCSSDLTFFVERKTKLNELKKNLTSYFKDTNYFHINNESLVSVDYKKMEQSFSIDMKWIKVNNNIIKVVLWYDNEWGFANRVFDLIKKLN